MPRVLLGLWSLFIVYGSFIPFRLTTDPGIVRGHLTVALRTLAQGRRSFSHPDVVSNVLLYVPLGLLLIASIGRGGPWRVLLSAVVAAACSSLIEMGQLFTVDRTASLLDVVCNTLGGLLGAAVAAVALRGGRRTRLAAFVRRRPVTLALAVIALAMMIDRLYPLAPTLDVATAWRNARKMAWIPFASVQGRYWWDVLVDLVLPPVLLAALLKTALPRPGPVPPACMAWLLTVAFAAVTEIARIFIAPRPPNVDYVVFAGLGGLIGATAVAAIAEWQRGRIPPGVALLVLAVVLLAYSELAPFDFRMAPAFVAEKLRTIEWLPFETYYAARVRGAMYDLWIKTLLSGFVGFAWARATGRQPWAAAAAGLAAGLVLEGLQLFTLSRRPSVTDVLVLATGAYVGGLAHLWYATWRECGSARRSRRRAEREES